MKDQQQNQVKPLSLLQSIWTRGNDVWDAIKEANAFKTLRAKAESDLLSMQSELVSYQDKVETAILKAKSNPDYKSIREAAIERDVKIAEFERAKLLYKEFFSKEPDFLY